MLEDREIVDSLPDGVRGFSLLRTVVSRPVPETTHTHFQPKPRRHSLGVSRPRRAAIRRPLIEL